MIRFSAMRIVRLGALSLLIVGGFIIALETLVRFFAPYESGRLIQLHNFFLGDGKYQAPVYDSSPTFCGMLSGRIITIDKAYISLFAEYAGVDSWTPRPKPYVVRTGCRHELKSLPLSMTWPEMLPTAGGGFPSSVSGIGSIQIGLGPQEGHQKFMHENLKRLLGEDAERKMAEAVEVLPGIKSAYGVSLVGPQVLYWTAIDSPELIVFRCFWSRHLERVFSCSGRYLMYVERVDVSISMEPENMLEVREIVRAVKQFVQSRLE